MSLRGLVAKLNDFLVPHRREEQQKISRQYPQPIKEVLAGMRGRYEERVKPFIESENYRAASDELGDIYSYWQIRAEELFEEVHSSLKYLTTMKTLIEVLKTATERPTDAIRAFEAYQAQTKLPSKKDLGEE